MTAPAKPTTDSSDDRPHARWVRVSHWLTAASVLTLAVSGFVILIAHPRLYWGEVGNDLVPALIELPISPDFRPDAWVGHEPVTADPSGPITANRTYEPYNQNGWARSLHFLAAWWLVLPGLIYLIAGLGGGHFRAHVWPRARELGLRAFGREIADHLRLRIPKATGGPRYGLLQKCAYTFVIFVAAPLVLLTGVTMSPAVTASHPWLLDLFGGYQSARTIHFFTFVALVLFVLAHLAMVSLSGFRRQIRGMTIGDPR